jgi:hypothetical protein
VPWRGKRSGWSVKGAKQASGRFRFDFPRSASKLGCAPGLTPSAIVTLSANRRTVHRQEYSIHSSQSSS